ncbi:MAG: hypothetical protein GX640_16645 [Fibrobacter sp.]|nr:hypothetical protein [Fibrobacter sp.]
MMSVSVRQFSCQSTDIKARKKATMNINGIKLDTSMQFERYPSGAVLSGLSAIKQQFNTIEIPRNASVFFLRTF